MDYRGINNWRGRFLQCTALSFAMILHSFRSQRAALLCYKLAQKVIFNAYPGAVFEAIMSACAVSNCSYLVLVYEQTTLSLIMTNQAIYKKFFRAVL